MSSLASASGLAPRVAGTMIRREVTPLLSSSKREVRLRVLNLYRSWYRQIPHILMDYDVPVDQDKCRAKLKEIFMANRDVKDIRAIDMLVAKGQMELRETIEVWKQKTHFMAFFRDSVQVKKTDFMSKFLDQ
ncbi:putative NADH dehydrogenase [ubiquinone] 1 alpha subcomplex subunit 6 [Hypsibius exemplaris]|uniref:NADH dehydrogenase [ubiquinone] 1 alpha subcomplex subunit 6 n=1 Tax=Hypsibius exemplaris TaxID=2072580 RepID=A0A1W0WSD8_HYPEX|nr:putative NADH dehydrogenase [ubiquinone] 1 alpha subcomplex subunit 6 [Hypsibius exemplaris]